MHNCFDRFGKYYAIFLLKRPSVLIGILAVRSLELWLCFHWSYDGALDNIAFEGAMMAVRSLELWLCFHWSYDGALDNIAFEGAMMAPMLAFPSLGL